MTKHDELYSLNEQIAEIKVQIKIFECKLIDLEKQKKQLESEVYINIEDEPANDLIDQADVKSTLNALEDPTFIFYYGDDQQVSTVKQETNENQQVIEENIATENTSEKVVVAVHLNQINTTIEYQRPYYCTFCLKSFNRETNLKYHVKIHHKNANRENEFNCKKCNYKTVKPANLTKHMAKHVAEEEEKEATRNLENSTNNKHKCNQCDYETACLTSFTEHFKQKHDETTKHIVEKRYACNFCGKKFPQMSNLNYHVRTYHTRENILKCSQCDYESASSANLKIHMIKHSGERNFSCNLCAKKFGHNRSLKYHMRTSHTREKMLKSKSSPSLNRNLMMNLPNDELMEMETIINNETPNTSTVITSLLPNFEELSDPPSDIKPPIIAITTSVLAGNARKKSLQKQLKCDVCSVEFSTSVELKKHEQTHLYFDELNSYVIIN